MSKHHRNITAEVVMKRNKTPRSCSRCAFLHPLWRPMSCRLLPERSREAFDPPFCKVVDFVRYLLEVI